MNEVPVPEPGEGQFLIKMASASLCHSDLMSIAIPGRTEPITLGHEGAGYIESMHPTSTGKGFNIGDSVGFLYVQRGCYECKGCLVHNNHCQKRPSQVNGFTIPGFFSEYALADWQNCIILPDNMDVKTASPMFCAGIAGECDLSVRFMRDLQLTSGVQLSIVWIPASYSPRIGL